MVGVWGVRALLAIFLGLSFAQKAFSLDSEKPKDFCITELQTALPDAINLQLQISKTLRKIEESFVVQSEAGRMGFDADKSLVPLSKDNVSTIIDLLKIKGISLKSLREIYFKFAYEFPNGNPDEWLRAIEVSAQLKVKPKDLYEQLKTLKEQVNFVTSASLGFGQKSQNTGVKFSDLFEIWILSRQLGKPAQTISEMVNEADRVFPNLSLGELLELLLWSHISKTELKELKSALSAIQTSFQLTTRKSIGFSKEQNLVTLSVEQALVIHKISVLTQTPLEKLLMEFHAITEKQQTQEVEDIITPLRNSAQATLDELMK